MATATSENVSPSHDARARTALDPFNGDEGGPEGRGIADRGEAVGLGDVQVGERGQAVLRVELEPGDAPRRLPVA